jgi:hypothetical protein
MVSSVTRVDFNGGSRSFPRRVGELTALDDLV